jgi:hypothetical protein|tara:strand:- start:645 stop:821 length:177 start_codon:yes stop_codon:yes gene_type:complete
MKKNLKPDEVISVLQKKVQLKRDIKELKSLGETKKAETLMRKVSQLDDKLHSRPLAKN